MPVSSVLEEIDIGLEVLDGLVERYLREFARVWVDFERQQITLGSVTYKLHHEEVGDSGAIELHKQGEAKTTMKISDPPRPPDRGLTPEEQEALAAISGKEEKLKAYIRLREKIWAEREALYLSRRKRHQRAIEALFQGMNHDPAWRAAMGEATTKEGAVKVKPPHPPLDASHDEWFNWFHLITDELGFKMNLKELALKMGLSHDYVRHLHMDYMAEHGGRKRHRITQE